MPHDFTDTKTIPGTKKNMPHYFPDTKTIPGTISIKLLNHLVLFSASIQCF